MNFKEYLGLEKDEKWHDLFLFWLDDDPIAYLFWIPVTLFLLIPVLLIMIPIEYIVYKLKGVPIRRQNNESYFR